MTVHEYIENNLPFYHITPICNIGSILQYGLQPRSYNAICVVRSSDEDIWDDIIMTQLSVFGKNIEFAVIKLTPSIHRIEAKDIAPDNVIEPTNDLHNYIVNKTICITADDIVKTIRTEDIKCKEIPKHKIERLTEYWREGKMSGFKMI